MLYVIAEQLGFPGIFNLIRYISFRAGAASATALLIGLLLGPWFISWLRATPGQGPADPLRRPAKPPRQARHADHGRPADPDLGRRSRSCCGWSFSNPYVWACLLVTAGFGLIGWLDDYDKVKKAHHAGPLGQDAARARVPDRRLRHLADRPHRRHRPLSAVRAGPVVDLGWFYIAFGAFVIVAFGNAVNLTDGLDGLATMPVIIASIAFLLITYLVGNAKFANYLGIPHVLGVGDLTVLLLAIVGAGPRLPVVQRAARRRSSWATPAASRSAERSARSRSRPTMNSCW